MLLAHKSYKLLVTGRSGSGKTTYWQAFLLRAKYDRRFVFDHQGELGIRLKTRPALHLEEIAAATARGFVLWDPVAMFPGRTEEAFAFWCEYSFAASQRLPGVKLFACDELQALVGTSQAPPALALVLETGRRYGLDCALISQQPNLIHNRIRNQLTEVVTFAQADRRSVDWLEEAGFDGEAVRRLRPGAWIARDLTTGAERAGRVF